MTIMDTARIRMDPRVVQRIQRSPTMMAEQGADWLKPCGGPSTYVMLARLPYKERVTYLSILGGSESATDVSLDTDGGLSIDEAQKALDSLSEKGLL